MKIWIDGYEANVPQRLGSSQIAFELIKNLEKIDTKNDYTILLAGEPLDDLPKERLGWRYKTLKFNKFKTYLAIPLALFFTKNRPDLFFSPTHYGPFLAPCKRVIMIFDLAFLKFRKMFKPRDLHQLTLWTKISVKKAAHVITISKSTKRDIIENYHLKKSMITVAYPGFDSGVYHPINDHGKIDQIKEKYKILGDYIIYIGTIQPRKNLVRLIEAFEKIDNLKLVIVGKTTGVGRQAWMFEDILNRPKELGILDKVIFTGFVPSGELPYLINGAEAFILPSLYEGFGIPPLEAMACGTPVLVSNTSSLPEVVGEAGLLFDPYSVTQIEQAIRTVVSDKKLRLKLSKASLNRSKQFSWEKMTLAVIKVFERTVNA